VGEYRVLYDLEADEKVVMILAIGLKSHNILWNEGKENSL
jgi:mRNA-degrading endonuclease RelE of RelBE toxin-antitoxin system